MSRRAAQRNGRGFFEVGVYHPKSSENVGTLWRTAQQLGAAGIFVIGRRYRKQSSDVLKTWRHVPMREHESFEAWMGQRPKDAVLVGVEMGGKPLSAFTHPERAVYLLGAEDHGLPPAVQAKCQQIVSLDAVSTESYNLAVAGSIILYDRVFGRLALIQRKMGR